MENCWNGIVTLSGIMKLMINVFSADVFILAGAEVGITKKQDVVALSTCECEFMAITEIVEEKLFIDLKQEMKMGNKLYVKVDNKAAIKLSKIVIYLHHYQRRNCQRDIDLEYIESKENFADFLTKPDTKSILMKCREKAGRRKSMNEKDEKEMEESTLVKRKWKNNSCQNGKSVNNDTILT